VDLSASQVEVDAVIGKDARKPLRDPSELEHDFTLSHRGAILRGWAGAHPLEPRQDLTFVLTTILPEATSLPMATVRSTNFFGTFLLTDPRPTPLFFRL